MSPAVTENSSRNTIRRARLQVNGIVQGVGFRPFVFNLAQRLGLAGSVANTSTGVIIEIEGPAENLSAFRRELRRQAPPLAEIVSVRTTLLQPLGENEFTIQPSDGQAPVATLVSPDMAVCADCLRELFDPHDRRYRYPFINCTNCGPRFSIIENIPYDRPFTTMKVFRMCSDCQREYEDPHDRRFHAQPNACPVCGPQLSWHDAHGRKIPEDDPLRAAQKALSAGFIVAIKGLGGFHLAVDAAYPAAVTRLRRRKNREEKPLAVMVRDLTAAERICRLSRLERELLTSPQAPIVLARKRRNHGLAEEVAPDNDRFGVMLPYTPLHHLLLDYSFRALVMTSGNRSEEPICIENEEAFQRLAGIADFFLVHNRGILRQVDDSVVMVSGGRLRYIRRSRGYAPRPIFVKSQGPTVLAVGGELKNTVCVLKGDQAFLSQHIGDLTNLRAYDAFQRSANQLQQLFQATPEVIAHDLHPQYLSTQWAREQPLPRVAVQHHHAHLAACMGENCLEGPVIGLILDGTGYGTDGTIWGGEILVGDYAHFERAGHLEPMPLPGGDAAIKAPWRTAVAYLYATGLDPAAFATLAERDWHPVTHMVKQRINTPLTSSCGRLFDAVAALCGGKGEIHYEAQAAVEWMQMALRSRTKADLGVTWNPPDQGTLLIPVREIIASVGEFFSAGIPAPEIARRFHRTLANLLAQAVATVAERTSLKRVVSSGGVFQNYLLAGMLEQELKRRGLRVFTHTRVPANDGGLALGQALIGRTQYQKQAGVNN